MHIRNEVIEYAVEMEKKLQANDHKKDWKSLSVSDSAWFLSRLKDEVAELEEALEIGTTEDIVKETADVGNFAMMIMDVFRREERDGIFDCTMGQPKRQSFSRQIRT